MAPKNTTKSRETIFFNDNFFTQESNTISTRIFEDVFVCGDEIVNIGLVLINEVATVQDFLSYPPYNYIVLILYTKTVLS
jgi:hypothetical protein